MNSELKIYKFELIEATERIEMLVESILFQGAKIESMKTEIWNDYLIVCITVYYEN